MQDIDAQVDYWNRMGPAKPFAHLVNFERLAHWLDPGSRITDVGCGYGRALALLFDRGYHNLDWLRSCSGNSSHGPRAF